MGTSHTAPGRGGPGGFHAVVPLADGLQSLLLGLYQVTQIEDLAGDRQACSHSAGYKPLLSLTWREARLCNPATAQEEVGMGLGTHIGGWVTCIVDPNMELSAGSCSGSDTE